MANTRSHTASTAGGVSQRRKLAHVSKSIRCGTPLRQHLPAAVTFRTIDDPYACLDFDNLTLPEPLAIWNELRTRTYCERSPSNVLHKGHAIVTLEPDAKRRLTGIRSLMPGIELYSDFGFFTVTFEGLNTLSIADASNFLWNLADKLNLQPPDTPPVPILTGRHVEPREIGRILDKIQQWQSAKQFFDMRSDWEAASRWAQRGNHGGPDRSMLMVQFVSMLVNADARDPDLLWAIIEPSVVWREFKGKWPKRPDYAEKRLWDDIVAKKLSIPVTPKPASSTFMLPETDK